MPLRDLSILLNVSVFLLLSSMPLQFIHSPFERHLGYLHFLVIMNKASEKLFFTGFV